MARTEQTTLLGAAGRKWFRYPHLLIREPLRLRPPRRKKASKKKCIKKSAAKAKASISRRLSSSSPRTSGAASSVDPLVSDVVVERGHPSAGSRSVPAPTVPSQDLGQIIAIRASVEHRLEEIRHRGLEEVLSEEVAELQVLFDSLPLRLLAPSLRRNFQSSRRWISGILQPPDEEEPEGEPAVEEGVNLD